MMTTGSNQTDPLDEILRDNFPLSSRHEKYYTAAKVAINAEIAKAVNKAYVKGYQDGSGSIVTPELAKQVISSMKDEPHE